MFIKAPKIATIKFEVKGQSIELIEVQGGTFLMGSNDYEDEKPIHEVEVDSFLLGKYPVTQALWAALMGETPLAFQGANCPVEGVSWYDATQFCNALSEQLGKAQVYKGSGENITIDYSANGFRLPTEAEWEYAARGGPKQAAYTYSGSDEVHVVGWYDENSHDETKPVGLKCPNALGLYDMSGNVWEWCNDWYGDDYYYYYSQSLANNPKGPEKGNGRVLRGGSWISNPQIMRVAYRSNLHPEGGLNYIGFRLCLPQFK
ncbi:MAG: formylglycine-generating enzyme family protein [Flammeovirgaceae bacterium]